MLKALIAIKTITATKNIKYKKMATGQGGILSALLLFAILFRLGLLQEPIYDAEYRLVNDLSFYACNTSHISKFDYVLSRLTVSTSDVISNSKLKTKTYMKAIKDPKMYCFILLV
jgi:hypothetical protein